MKNLFSLTLLLVVCLNVMSQQFKIDSIGKKKNQTIELFCTSMTGQKAVLYFGVRGMGRPFIFVGDYVTYFSERRRNKIQRNN